MTNRTTFPFAATLVLTAALVGCTPAGEAPGSPAPGDLPGCAEAFPIDEVRGASGRPGVELLDLGEPPGDAVPPTGEQAAAAATRIEYCPWGNENSGFGFTGILAELPEEATAQLLTQLSGTVYDEYDLDGAQGFTRDSEVDVEHAETHILLGDVWIVVSGYLSPDQTRAVAEVGLAGVRAAAPTAP